MRKKADQWWIADFETTTPDTEYFKRTGDVSLTLGGAMSEDGRTYIEYTSIAEFLAYVFNRRIKRIYAHNLAFDGDFIVKHLMLSGWRWANPSVKLKPREFRAQTDGAGVIYTIECKAPNGAFCRFACSYRLLSASVKMLGKGLKVDKYKDIDESALDEFYKVEPQSDPAAYPQTYRDYLRRDCDIVRLSLLAHFSELAHMWRMSGNAALAATEPTKPITAGGTAYLTLKGYAENFSRECLEGMSVSVETYNKAEDYFFGGFTQFNALIQNKVHQCVGMSIDRNSMHPASMCLPMPYGEPHNGLEEPPPAGSMVFYRLRVKYAYSRFGHIATLANWGDEFKELRRYRYRFKLRDFECFYQAEVFDELKKWNVFQGVSVLECWWFKTANYMEAFIRDLYAIREKHKRNGDKARSLTAKIIINSAYGKNAERLAFPIVYNCKNERQKAEWLKAKRAQIDGEWYSVHKGYYSWEDKAYNQNLVRLIKETPPEKGHNKFIACAITGYSFIALLRTIRRIGVERFLYCDTDSVYFKNPPKNLNKIVDIDDNRLGAWKIEKRFNYIAVKGAKAYLVSDKPLNKLTPEEKEDSAHFAGVSKKWLRDNLSLEIYTDPEEQMFRQAKLVPLRCRSGIALVYKDYIAKKREH